MNYFRQALIAATQRAHVFTHYYTQQTTLVSVGIRFRHGQQHISNNNESYFSLIDAIFYHNSMHKTPKQVYVSKYTKEAHISKENKI